MLVRHKVQRLLPLLLLFTQTGSHNPEDSVPDNPRRLKPTDPVSNFFSELGDLFLDVDQAIAVQTKPKIEHETNVMSQLFRPRPDYFNRIQNNYKEIQKRLGTLIGNTIGFRSSYSDHELSTVGPPPESFVPTIGADYNPFTAAAEDRKEKLKEKISKTSFEPATSVSQTIDESLKAFGKLSLSIIDDIGDLSKERKQFKSVGDEKDSLKRSGSIGFEECGNEILEDPDLEKRRQERCSQIAAEERVREDLKTLMLDPKRATGALFSKSTVTLDNIFKKYIRRRGDSSVENDKTESTDRNYEAVELVEASNECLGDVLEDPALESVRREKCALITAEERLIRDLNKILQDPKEESLFPGGSKAINDVSSILKRSGDVEDTSSVYVSDPSLDKQIRQLIKDHGSWILDYPLIKRWREWNRSNKDLSNEQSSEDTLLTSVEDSSDIVEVEPTEFYLPVSADYEMALEKSGDSVSGHPHNPSYYRIINQDGDIMEEEMDFVLNPESISNDIETEPKETVILAFTSDGVPLKLRLEPEIDNPIEYLHKLLQSAGVSLNIPVQSYDDLEPVGKEVLKLGSGILTRAVLIDASDSNEMKSLLKALMVSKATGKTSF